MISRQEAVPVLLLINRHAKWNLELENLYLISCEIISDGNRCIQHHFERAMPQPMMLETLFGISPSIPAGQSISVQA
jgi:hypothetical protein